MKRVCLSPTYHSIRHHAVTFADWRGPRAMLFGNPSVEFLLADVLVVVVREGEPEEAFLDGCHEHSTVSAWSAGAVGENAREGERRDIAVFNLSWLSVG